MATGLDAWDVGTRYYVIPSYIDIVSRANTLVNLGIRKAQFMDGGSFVSQPIITGLPTESVKAFTGAYRFPDNFDEDEAGAVYPINFYAVNIQMTVPDLARNRGSMQVLNLYKTRMKKAEVAMRQRFGSDIYGDGTADGGAAFTGLKAYIDNGDSYDNYAGISRSAVPDWAATALSNNSNRALTTSLIDTAEMDASMGAERPNLHVTTKGLVNKLAQLIQPIQRTVQGDLGSWGFKNIAYKGYPVVSDDFVPTSPGELYYLLNTRYMQFWFLTGWFFQWVPFMRIPGTSIWCAQIYVATAFVGNNPARQAVIQALDSTK